MAEYSAGQFVKLVGQKLNEKGQGMSNPFFLVCFTRKKKKLYCFSKQLLQHTHTLCLHLELAVYDNSWLDTFVLGQLLSLVYWSLEVSNFYKNSKFLIDCPFLPIWYLYCIILLLQQIHCFTYISRIKLWMKSYDQICPMYCFLNVLSELSGEMFLYF